MVGIVLVSHSAELAQAVKALAEQQTRGRAPIATVGGTGDPTQPYGTDALAILAAIQAVYADDGVLVLMDLGTAVLSAEAALEFLEPEQAARVKLSHGPFVEGAMAAAVQAAVGSDLATVAAEAATALQPKADVLHVPFPSDYLIGQSAAVEDESWDVTSTATLVNPAGLHFGPAALFVQAAAAFRASVTLRNQTTGAGPVNAKRFNQVLGLGAGQGHTIELYAKGSDASAAIEALVALINTGLGGTLVVPVPVSPRPPAVEGAGRVTLYGSAASPGFAVGVAVRLSESTQAVPRFTAPDAANEWARFTAAVAQAHTELTALSERMARELGREQSLIFAAHALVLDDPDVAAAVRAALARQVNLEAAIDDVFTDLAHQYSAIADQRLQARAADLEDVRIRLLHLLRSEGTSDIVQPASDLPAAVLIATDLSPSQTAALDRRRVVAICTAAGSPTSHSAILAHSMGIPAVVGLGAAGLAQITEGMRLAVDGSAGRVIVDPDASTCVAFAAHQQQEAEARRGASAAAQSAAHTRDGQRIEVAANLSSAAETLAALEAGAEGVGVLRTEFLFQARREPPSEEDQVAVYRQVAATMHPRAVIIRTLDIGGDKPAPYLPLPIEANPFLGWRAIRISLDMPDFFKTQLRAILRAAVDDNVKIMFPMVTTSAEVEQAHRLLAEAAAELQSAHVPHATHISTGIMVEVPAAVESADHLAMLVDFLSIGTNDLTQYTFAADRGNARVAALGDPLHPALLRQIARVIDAAHAHGKWVGVCGELAAHPEAIPILLGLGLDEFSMAPPAIPMAKALIARIDLPAARELARSVVTLRDGAAVRTAVDNFLRRLPG